MTETSPMPLGTAARATDTPATVAPVRVQVGHPLLFAGAGILFAAYQLLRPYADEGSLTGALAMAGARWQISHILAMLSFALLSLAQLAVARAAPVYAHRAAVAAAGGAGIGLFGLLPYYGGETFGLHAVATEALARSDPSLLTLADDVRMAPFPVTFFTLGSVGLLVSAVATMLALVRSGRGWRCGLPFVVTAGLFVPQFFGTSVLRMGYGILFAVALAVVAFGWRPARTKA